MNRTTKHRGNRKNHSNIDSYENRLLHTLRNEYSEADAVKLVEQENSLVRTENGKHVSYIAELEEKLKKLENMAPDERALWKIQRKQNGEISELKRLLEKYQKSAKDWQSAYFKLLNRQKEAPP